MLNAITPGKLFTLLSLFDLIEHEKSFSKAMSKEEKQAKASEIIKNHVGFSLGAALIPLPGADLLAVSGVQLNMLRQLAKLYNVSFFDTLGKNIVSAIVGGSAARLGASLVKAIPGVGTIIGELSMPILSGASTWALGRTVAAVQKFLPVAIQLTAQFIRTLRNGILLGMRWARALELLRAATKSYL